MLARSEISVSCFEAGQRAEEGIEDGDFLYLAMFCK